MTIFTGQRVRIREPYHLAGHCGLVHETYKFSSVEVLLDGGSTYFVCGSLDRSDSDDFPRVEDVLETLEPCKSEESK